MAFRKIGVTAIGMTALASLLSGCSSQPKKTEIVDNDTIVLQPFHIAHSLTGAAAQASEALTQLAAIEKAEHPVAPMPFMNIQDPALEQPLLIHSYYGPMAAIVQLIAQKTGYQVQIYGKPPVIPILINLQLEGPEPAIELLRNIDLQAGLDASLMVLPTYKIISLRYMTS
jgi:defect in organelle trafficking protein DotD